jgi:hypothetical protein
MTQRGEPNQTGKNMIPNLADALMSAEPSSSLDSTLDMACATD